MDYHIIKLFFQMTIEVQSWPYTFPASEDFPTSDQRGNVSGRLLVQDGYVFILNRAALCSYFLHFIFVHRLSVVLLKPCYKYIKNKKILTILE